MSWSSEIPPNSEALIASGIDRFRANNFDSAIADFDQAIRFGSGADSKVYHYRGVAYARKGQLDKAIADFDRAIEISPSDGTAYYFRGKAKHLSGNVKQAISDYDCAIKLDPANSKAMSAREAAISKLTDDILHQIDPSALIRAAMHTSLSVPDNIGQPVVARHHDNMSSDHSSTKLHRLYARARLDDREVNELIGLAHGLVAHGAVTKDDVDYLHKWCVAHTAATVNPVVKVLLDRIDRVLAHGDVNPEEAHDIFELLKRFAGGDFEIGETVKSATLFFSAPAPRIRFRKSRFCFTGTFAFGTRRECEAAVIDRGGAAGELTRGTNYLIVGSYATDSWQHSTFGRKIEKAAAMREESLPIAIIGENDWATQVRQADIT